MHACMLATCVLQACYMHATLIMHFTCIQHHYTMHVYQTCMYMLCNMHVTCITFRVGRGLAEKVCHCFYCISQAPWLCSSVPASHFLAFIHSLVPPCLLAPRSCPAPLRLHHRDLSKVLVVQVIPIQP